MDIAFKNIVLDVLFGVWIKERFYRVFIAKFGVTFELLTGRSKSGASVQMTKKVDICVRRMRNGCHRKTSRGLTIRHSSRRTSHVSAL